MMRRLLNNITEGHALDDATTLVSTRHPRALKALRILRTLPFYSVWMRGYRASPEPAFGAYICSAYS